MNLTPVLRRAALAPALLGLLAGPLAAQNILLAEHDGKFLAVHRAHDNRSLVQVDGKMVTADGRRFALKKTEEYRPEFVDVRDLDVKTQYLNLMGGGELNHDFIFHAVVVTPYYLDDVFIVLELDTAEAGKVLFLQEVGNLTPGDPKTISVTVPLSGGLGEGKYQFHLFAGGLELLTTKMPSQVRDELLDRMTFKRIAGVQEALPKLFTGPPPEYPRAMLKSGSAGHVMIALRIGANGQVYDPRVTSATDPAFGESALAAVRLWRFLPRVIQGRPTEASVSVPVDFDPPAKKS